MIAAWRGLQGARFSWLLLPGLVSLLLCALPACALGQVADSVANSTAWVRPAKAGDPLIWGRRDGLVFGLASPGGIKGPRGLIRIGVYKPGEVQPELINFVAIEPVVAGPGKRFDRMAFSEMEPSQMDPGQGGKRMWVHGVEAGQGDVRGTLETMRTGKAVVERLSVRIDVERFGVNGAHVYVIASMDSDHPGEVRFTPHAEPDSPPLEELTTTATMGNYERLRVLWLSGHSIYSKEVFAGYAGTAFLETPGYPLAEMLRNEDGDALVYCSSDEASPAQSPGNAKAHWIYPLAKYTQYWRVAGADVQADLRVHVNGRRVYFGSTAPLPGGVAFENFEVRQRFVDGQSFIFGLTEKEPWQAYEGSEKVQAPPEWLNQAPGAMPVQVQVPAR